MLKIQLCITGINYILNDTKIENNYFLDVHENSFKNYILTNPQRFNRRVYME